MLYTTNHLIRLNYPSLEAKVNGYGKVIGQGFHGKSEYEKILYEILEQEIVEEVEFKEKAKNESGYSLCLWLHGDFYHIGKTNTRKLRSEQDPLQAYFEENRD
uniref:Phage protein n=1 Tax=Rhabditophanes sp. KR3021 TaxID=114890 RepID=A0AC35TTP9_9BILA